MNDIRIPAGSTYSRRDLIKLAAQAVSFRSARAWQKSSQRIGAGLKLWAAPASIDGLANSIASAVIQIL